jgi:protein phosphatase methylesterase 1
MSDLQRSFAKAKLANLPLPDIFDEKDAEEEAQESIGELRMDHSGDDDSSSASSASSTGTIIPTPTKHLFARPNG